MKAKYTMKKITIGKRLKTRKIRGQIIIATKVGARPQNLSQNDFSNMEGLSKKTIKNLFKHHYKIFKLIILIFFIYI
ncbi:hypothetical protein [Candidatus Stoquefichus massiliensis]|uniref:hypothetical protein n=1 Tax=Candidatus Stoquefichus massiliensis TaxID=1470350 RepID=UPI0004BA2A4E|nr:hypothetical protein [Candidatus Stoquefichus massiliensis]